MLVNFFDCAIVFAVALILISAASTSGSRNSPEAAPDQDPAEDRVALQRYRAEVEKAKGEGVRLGVAYRLASGEVVYVPDENSR